MGTERHGSKAWTGWANLIPEERWTVYRRILEAATACKIPFSLAGAFATATHTGYFRDTNDMDVYTLPEHHEEMKRVVEGTGLNDIYDQFPYDRNWTYRATDGKSIFEVIWKMRNGRADVDMHWITGWGDLEFRGIRMFVTPPEEMMWAKLYVLHRLRTDWPDVLNYINSCGEGLDWLHLFDRLGPDFPLLGGALSVFAWLSPGRVDLIPEWVWGKFGLCKPDVRPVGEKEEIYRAELLFGPQNPFSHKKAA